MPEQLFPIWSDLTLSELMEFRTAMEKRLPKLLHADATATNVLEEFKPIISASISGDRLLTLERFLHIRPILASAAPFYPWARSLLLRLPIYEAKVFGGDPREAVREAVDEVVKVRNHYRNVREAILRELPEVSKRISKGLSKMLQKQAGREKDRQELMKKFLEEFYK